MLFANVQPDFDLAAGPSSPTLTFVGCHFSRAQTAANGVTFSGNFFTTVTQTWASDSLLSIECATEPGPLAHPSFCFTQSALMAKSRIDVSQALRVSALSASNPVIATGGGRAIASSARAAAGGPRDIQRVCRASVLRRAMASLRRLFTHRAAFG
jgi:hypothetical protein